MAAARSNSGSDRPRRPPAKTPEAREQQMISAAIDLAEKQILAGTASSQVIVHYLKLGTPREELEREKIRLESVLLAARAEDIASGARIEELYKDAIVAMRGYGGQEALEDDDR